MIGAIKEIFSSLSVSIAEVIPFAECRVINERKLAALPFQPKSVIVFAIPYYAGDFPQRNLSLYALAKDYHLFFASLSRTLCEALSERYPRCHFAPFADNSPIDERDAAAKAGLGMRGKNGLLITERYASFVFLGEILTDIPYEEIGTLSTFPIRECEGCGRCLAACPKKETCLSALTQKKGELSKSEREELYALGSAWGCDICQIVCPHAAKAEITPISFFKESLIPVLTPEVLHAMSEEEFRSRAYAWRGRNTILRNLLLLLDE